MTTPKIVAQTKSCGECPNYQYYSADRYECALVDQVVSNKNKIAPFCPLPDYPARTIAEMGTTIRFLRDSYGFNFGSVLLAHIAAKLKLNVDANGSGISIPLKNESTLFLELATVRSCDAWSGEVTFFDRKSGHLFRLLPDTDPPRLHEAADADGKTWVNVSIA